MDADRQPDSVRLQRVAGVRPSALCGASSLTSLAGIGRRQKYGRQAGEYPAIYAFTRSRHIREIDILENVNQATNNQMVRLVPHESFRV